MNTRRNASNSGSIGTRQQTKRHGNTNSKLCPPHHWLLENTKYPLSKPNVGQINLGRTRSRCKRCGKTRRWESPTPDSIHGIESLVAFNIRLEDDALPEGFSLEDERLEEDCDA